MISCCPDQASVYSLGGDHLLGVGHIGAHVAAGDVPRTPKSMFSGPRCGSWGARLNGYVGKLPDRTCAPVATDAWLVHSRRGQAPKNRGTSEARSIPSGVVVLRSFRCFRTL